MMYNSSFDNTSRVSYIRPYDNQGAMMYIVCTISFYCLGIVAFLMTYLCKDKSDYEDDIATYLRYSAKRSKAKKNTKTRKKRSWLMANNCYGMKDTGLQGHLNEAKCRTFRQYSCGSARGEYSQHGLQPVGINVGRQNVRDHSYPGKPFGSSANNSDCSTDGKIYHTTIREENLLDEISPLIIRRSHDVGQREQEHDSLRFCGRRTSVNIARQMEKSKLNRSLVEDFNESQIQPKPNGYCFLSSESEEIRMPVQARSRRESVSAKGSENLSQLCRSFDYGKEPLGHNNSQDSLECNKNHGDIGEHVVKTTLHDERSSNNQFDIRGSLGYLGKQDSFKTNDADHNEEEIATNSMSLDVDSTHFGGSMTRLGPSYNSSDSEDALLQPENRDGGFGVLDDHYSSSQEIYLDEFTVFPPDSNTPDNRYNDIFRENHNSFKVKSQRVSGVHLLDIPEKPFNGRLTNTVKNLTNLKLQPTRYRPPSELADVYYNTNKMPDRRRSLDQFTPRSFLDKEDVKIQHFRKQTKRRKSTGASRMTPGELVSGYKYALYPQFYCVKEDRSLGTVGEHLGLFTQRRTSFPVQRGCSMKQRPSL